MPPGEGKRKGFFGYFLSLKESDISSPVPGACQSQTHQPQLLICTLSFECGRSGCKRPPLIRGEKRIFRADSGSGSYCYTDLPFSFAGHLIFSGNFARKFWRLGAQRQISFCTVRKRWYISVYSFSSQQILYVWQPGSHRNYSRFETNVGLQTLAYKRWGLTGIDSGLYWFISFRFFGRHTGFAKTLCT